MNTVRQQIEAAGVKYMLARDALEKQLAKAYPRNAFIQFNLQSGQINPSRGRVVAHHVDCVVIRMDNARGTTKRVHYAAVLP